MIRYALRRAAWYGFVLAVVNAGSYLVTAYLAIRQRGAVRTATYGGRERVVSDPAARPDVPLGEVVASFRTYLGDLAAGELVVHGNDPVSTLLLDALPKSLLLLVLALGISVVAGVLIGYLSFDRTRRKPTSLALSFNLVAYAMPAFYVGIVAIQLMIVLGRFTSGRGTVLPATGYGLDAHLVLPVLVLALRPTAEIGRLTSELLADELGKDYVRAALAKGVSWRWMMLRHAFRNVAGSIVVAVGNATRYLLSSLILVELLFSWPGVGRALATAVAPRVDGRAVSASLYDPVLVATLVTALALLSILVSYTTGLGARLIDPRLREPA